MEHNVHNICVGQFVDKLPHGFVGKQWHMGLLVNSASWVYKPLPKTMV